MAAYDYTPLYGAGDIIPGTTAGILANLGIENPNVPVFRLLGSENKGGTNVNESMNFAAIPGQSYRLVNKATGAVLGEATTPEEISALVEQSNALSKQLGKKADLSFEQSTGGAYSPIFKDQPNILFDTPMKLIAAGMLAATGAGLLQPGGLSGVGAVGTGGATGTTAAATGSGLVPGALQGANALSFAPVATTAVPASVAAPIVVTATGSAIPAVVPAAVTAAAATPSLLSSAATPPSQPPAATAAPTPPAFPEELIVTAKNAAPVTFGDVAPALLPSVGAALSSAVSSTATPDLSQPAEADQKGFLKKPIGDWNFSDWRNAATLASLGVSGIGSLFGGSGGGTGTAMPYVSPFGPDIGVGGLPSGQNRQLNPNIADYEKYGFGPEALFYAPQSIASAPTTAGPESATVNPKYVPLI